MATHAPAILFLATELLAIPVSAAGQVRFLDQAESTILVSADQGEQTARIWIGVFEIPKSSSAPEKFMAAGVYLPPSKLFWSSWTPSFGWRITPQDMLENFKKNAFCGANTDTLACFFASPRTVHAKAVSEKVDLSDIPTLISQRVAQLGDASLRSWWSQGWKDIRVEGIEDISALYEDVDATGGAYQITKVQSTKEAWELTIRNEQNDRVGLVRLDKEMRPLSGAMIKK
jgi:hypothetical protein